MKFIHNRVFRGINESVVYYQETHNTDESKITANIGLTKVDRGELRKITSELVKKSKKTGSVLSVKRDFSGNDSSGYSAEFEDVSKSNYDYQGNTSGSVTISSVSSVKVLVNTSDKTVSVTYHPYDIKSDGSLVVTTTEKCKGLTKVINYSKLVQFPYSDIKESIARGIDLCRDGLNKIISRFMSSGIKSYESGEKNMRGDKYPAPDSSAFYAGLSGNIDAAFNGSVSKISLKKAKS